MILKTFARRSEGIGPWDHGLDGLGSSFLAQFFLWAYLSISLPILFSGSSEDRRYSAEFSEYGKEEMNNEKSDKY
jgi:hypothetical protein